MMNSSTSSIAAIAIPASQPARATESTAGGGIPPALLLFGQDDKLKPHASWFTAEQVEGATAAGAVMGMYALAVPATGELADLAGKLPRGKLFGSGKAFVPFVAREVFNQLVAELPEGTPTPLRLVKGSAEANSGPAGGGALPPPVDGNRDLPSDWSKIKLGSLVLAKGEPDDWPGWYEAIVTDAKPGEIFWLRWRDWPEDKVLVRHRNHLALLPPGFATA